MANSCYAIGFPGREAFYKGMDSSFYNQYKEFREIYEIAGDYIGEDLHKISFQCQSLKPELHAVCLITYCYALYKVLMKYLDQTPLCAAGFSQGEFTAITAAGGLAFPEVLQLVYRLENLVAGSKKIQDGIMVRIVELDREVLARCCSMADPTNKSISIAIHLSNDQNIISGSKEVVDKVCDIARQYKYRWAIPLSSGGAFHSPLCSDILAAAESIFDEYEFLNTRYDVYSCTHGRGSQDGRVIKNGLIKQIAMPILWNRIIESMYKSGIRHMIELGTGCTISGNSRLIRPEITYSWVSCVDDLKSIVI